jgi:hypothetical protein
MGVTIQLTSMSYQQSYSSSQRMHGENPAHFLCSVLTSTKIMLALTRIFACSHPRYQQIVRVVSDTIGFLQKYETPRGRNSETMP